MTTAQAATLELFLNGAWRVVPLYSAEGVTITRGIDADGTWPRPAKIECAINNDSLDYDPSLPQSSLYGVVSRNVKTRVKVAGTTRTWAEASEYAPQRTPEHTPGTGRGRSSVQFTAEGLLRRIGKWTDPLRSPMYRTISGWANSLGHWSLEDDQGATRLSNSLATGGKGTFRGVTLGDSTAPGGAAQAARIAVGSSMTGGFALASSTTGWQVSFAMRLPAIPPSATYSKMLRWKTSNGYDWSIEVNNTNYRVTVTDSSGTLLLSDAAAQGGYAAPNQWVTFRLSAQQSGGSVSVALGWYREGAPVLYGSSPTFIGAVGGIRQWWQEGATATAGGWVSHVFGVTGVADNLLSGDAVSSFNGYVGERAGLRFNRLCGELGINRYISGASDTTQMGPQRAATFLSLLREIRDTEDGEILDERFDQPALTMFTRRSLYAQDAALTLTYAQVGVPFQKVVGDEGVRNLVTVKNANGGDLTVSQTTGPLSVAPPPSGVGEYRSTEEVNVDNEAVELPLRAAWELAKGTLERPRYVELTVDLLANPGLVASVVAVNIGNRIDVTGAEAEPVRLLVRGIVDRIGKSERTVTFSVEPYEPYEVGVYDDNVTRYDARTSTLVGAQTSTSVSWAVQCTDPGDVWTVKAASYPLDWMVAGERVRVTAMTAATGTGPYSQTATVQRSINGIVKAQLATTKVEVADAKRWGY